MSDLKSKRICAGCMYFNYIDPEDPIEDTQGECVRFPPQLIPAIFEPEYHGERSFTVLHTIHYEAHWPDCIGTHTCGEFKKIGGF
jgi:hypothetical protein